MKHTLLIVNPTAGRGAADRAVAEIRSQLCQYPLKFDVTRTQYAGHGIALAQKAAEQGFDAVAAVGGDGTLNEVINGLMAARNKGLTPPALGLLPVGRGNDFAFSMGLPLTLPDSCRVLATGQRQAIDIGLLTGGNYPQGRYFGNGVGIGFDAMVNYEASRLTRLRGFFNYLVAVFKALALHFNAPEVEIECDGQRLITSTMMVSVMNGRRLGGGFLMAPNSSASDGKFDISIVRKISRLAAFGLIPHFIKGTQIGHPAVMFSRASKIVVRAVHDVLPAHGDGEMLSLTGQHLTIEMLPKQLELLVA